jgi:hypothetical protein
MADATKKKAGKQGRSSARKQAPKKKKPGKAATNRSAPDPLGIGSHHVVLDDRVIFGDYEFTRHEAGNYSVTFFDVGCDEQGEPAPVIFTNAGAGRHVGVQGWGCEDGDLTVWFTGEDSTATITDFDFDWIVYRG